MCDGYTSSAILWLYIKDLFPQSNLNFIVHDKKQHGLNDKVDWIEDNAQFDLVILPDAGSYDIEEHKRLGELGMDIIILDHHSQAYDGNGNPIISKAPNTIIVNNQLSDNYENKTLCGAGVTYKFCEVLDNILGISKAYQYIDLAALGEIADVMDKRNTETNYIIEEGLRNIKNKGLQTLIEAQMFSLKDKAVYPYCGLTSTDVAFYIAPLINAIVRVGTLEDKQVMFYCFIEPNKVVPSTKRGAKIGDNELAAERTARVGANAKSKQNRIKDKALEYIDFLIQKNDLLQNNIIIIELDNKADIPQEMTGLIAMGVVSKYGKPCIIGRNNNGYDIQGSARSNSNFNGLPNFKEYLENSGFFNYAAGHDSAFGVSLSKNKLNDFLAYANSSLDSSAFESCYTVDYILDAKEDNTKLLYSLAEHQEYFGNHIDEIKIVVENIELSNILAMGTEKDSLRISFNNVDYVHFKDKDFVDLIYNNRMKLLNVYGRANINNFNGRTSIQVFIDDYELVNNEDKYAF